MCLCLYLHDERDLPHSDRIVPILLPLSSRRHPSDFASSCIRCSPPHILCICLSCVCAKKCICSYLCLFPSRCFRSTAPTAIISVRLDLGGCCSCTARTTTLWARTTHRSSSAKRASPSTCGSLLKCESSLSHLLMLISLSLSLSRCVCDLLFHAFRLELSLPLHSCCSHSRSHPPGVALRSL